MGVVYHRYQKEPLLSCRNAMSALALACFAFAAQNSASNAQPVLSPPVLVSNTWAQMRVSNCYNTYAQYLLQVSTNLTDWGTLTNYSSTGNNFSVLVPVNGSACFYRLEINFPPAFGILCKTNLDTSGNNFIADSFDSSTAFAGQYTVAVRQANANIGAYKVINSLNVGNTDIYGNVYTGIGPATNFVEIGRKGSVGDIAWVNATNYGIEPGHWETNLNIFVPDVVAPNTAGWLTALPAPTNGVVMLTNAGAAYVVSNLPSSPLVVTAPTTIWVQGSASLGVTLSNATWVAGGVTNTTIGQLILYVGRWSGWGDSLTWSAAGGSNIGYLNSPGYASRLQIYGLPSLTSIDFHGDTAWIGTIYAPEAAFVAGGGGNSAQDVSGQIVVNSLTLNGHWHFHYDQFLATLNLRP